MNKITEEMYWNDLWENLNIRLIMENDRYWGSKSAFIKVINKNLGCLEGLRVLEIGGASSYFLLALAKWCKAYVTALDYSSTGLQAVEQIFHVNKCKVETVQADFLEWDSKGRQFDVVVHFGFLEHFLDPSIIIHKCSKLLAPNGKLFFTMPNMNAWGAYFWKNWSPSNWAMHVLHSDKDIKLACESEGLHITRVFYYGPPLLQLVPWERNGILQSFVTITKRCFNLINRAIPIYHFGIRYISTHRAFVVTK